MRASVLSIMVALSQSPAYAQTLTPQTALQTLIPAFQNCGPYTAYQILDPPIFNLIASQTGGLGCFPYVRALGPLQSLSVEDQVKYPTGYVYNVRATHTAGQLYWQIGIISASNLVGHLNYSATKVPIPKLSTNEGGTEEGGGKKKEKSIECLTFPDLCP